MMSLMTSVNSYVNAQQIPNSDFEDWSGATFDGNPQPKYWNASNVEQVGFKFNFAHKEAGHNGGTSLMVQDQKVGAMGITETSPGYFSLGHAWVYLEGINSSTACAGTHGGYAWTYRPDTMSVWIRRTGNNVDKEDFYLLYYAWTGETRADKYPNKGGGCTSVTQYDEESDVRQALDPNRCGTAKKGTQVAEGMWREKKYYGDWTNIKVPVYYFNDLVPEKVNLLFSASNYPNGSSSAGLYEGNSLYVDDIELIYSAKIQKLIINEIEWKGFDPNSTEVQTYSLGESATAIPNIVAKRGVGTITNAAGTTASFPGRTLSGNEIKIEKGDLVSKPTTITVKSADGKHTMTYKIQFQKAASSNAKLASISYSLDGETFAIPDFSPTKMNYTVDLPYGTTTKPTLSAEKQEDAQKVTITQPESVTGTGKIVVTAANGSASSTYNVTFRVAALSDNTLADIKVNGKSIPGFTPSQAVYKVSLPVGTSTLSVTPVPKYPGEQTIVVTPNPLPSGEAINGTTVQIAVTTPGNTVAKTYKLNIKLEASSYSYLNDLTVEGFNVDFDPEQTTYYVNLPLGTTSLPTIRYERGDEYQNVEVSTLPAGVLDGTVRVTVTAGNGSDQTVYKIVFSVEKSDVSTLEGIKVGGVLIEDFDPNVTSYTVALPIGTTELPEIEPIAHDAFQTINITYGGLSGKTRISVTAGNGATTIYQLTFVVATYSNNKLKSLAVEGYDIHFDPEVNDYYVNLAKGTTTLPAVTYEAMDAEFQTVTVRPMASGVTGDYKITVRPSSGASRTYVIHFSIDKSNNTALKAILLDNEPLASFHPDTLNYVDSLPEGVSRIPNVTFEKSENSQRVLCVLEGTKQIITVTAESGDTRVYTIQFIVRASENAFLKMIYLDGDSLPGFESKELEYEVQLAGDRCPAITVDTEEGQQVTITAPYGAGEAVIRVQPGAGAANLYVIQFKAEAAETVRLSDIRINGVSIEGFDPAKTHYEATYAGLLPTVEGVAAGTGQTVSPASWKDETAWIYVVDAAGNKASYSVTFTRTMQTNSKLQAIYADGKLIDGFDADSLLYSYEIPAGSEYPQIRYKVSDATQVVFFGQTADGEWTIRVAAENGTFTSYVVRYTIAKYNDPTLADLVVEGHSLTFLPETTDYNLTLDEGEALPVLTPTARMGQTVMSYAVNANEQRMVVTAENGTTKTYIIHYQRTLSSNASLRDILVDGQSIAGFHPDSMSYSVILPTGTKVVPNVFAVAQLDNQTITTYFSRPNGTTRVHVVAQDGKTTKDYTIDFPVTPSTNTKLGSLSIDGESKDVNETEYFFTLPYGTTEPYDVMFEKASPEQLIDYQLGGLNDVTRITVKAENNDSRTYTIRYKVAEPEGENVIARAYCKWVTAEDETVNATIDLKGDTVVDVPYGTKSFSVDSIAKNYKEQSVVFYNGGIRRGATIIVSANREGEPDKTYTIVPKVPAYEQKGKLKMIQFRGEDIPNFRPDVYNYVVKVTDNTAVTDGNFTAQPFSGTSILKGKADHKKKQIQITTRVGGVSVHTYSICWYYETDADPFDLSDPWVMADKETGMKPSNGWKVPADYTEGLNFSLAGYNIPYTSGKEVSPYGDNGVMLATIRQGALRGSLPGMMTLGEMTFSPATNGGSTSSVTCNATVGKQFRNTPESLEFEYDAMRAKDIDSWSIWMTLSDGSTYAKTTFSGDYSTPGKTKASIPIIYPDVKTPTTIINATLNSCHTENAKDMNAFGANQSSDLVFQNMHLVYNSELTAAKVNGVAATKSGNTFTANVADDYIGVPSLEFTGAVHDQTQVIEWLNEGEWLYGKLTARVINYGENLKDSTHYFVVVKRKAETSLDYTIDFGSYAATSSGDTVFVTMPFGTKALPDISITPGSIHQRFAIDKNGQNVKVTVTAENGNKQTTVYAFRTKTTDVATLEAFSAEDYKGADVPLSSPEESGDTTRYTFSASLMPDIHFERPEGVQGQTIVVTSTASRATMLVTAATGDKTHTYIFDRIEPVVVTDAQLKDFRIGDNDITEFGEANTDKEMERPTECVFFTRKFDSDSVVFIQDEKKMQWQVYGTVNKTYTLSYPTELSNKKTLKAVRVNGQDYTDFDPSYGEYTFVRDSMLVLVIEPAEASQTLTTTCEIHNDTTVFTTVVEAENGDQNTYVFTNHSPKSDIKSLAAIMADSVVIAGFHPDTLNYTVVLPSPAYKVIEPQMPSISYTVGDKHQIISLTPTLVLGEPIEIEVQSELGSHRTYNVTVEAEPSHCTELSGIMVNGVPLDDFEPGSHKYSVMLKNNDVTIEYTSNDRFQHVVLDSTMVEMNHYRYTLTVTAEDGVSTSVPYTIEVYIENKSSDAQLANITLDGKEMVDFEPEINGKLTFDSGNNLYNINLPSGTTMLPQVSAQLKMDGQSVEIIQSESKVDLKVTAVDGTENTYQLNFHVPLSKNANLSMIFLGTDSLPNFDPNYYFYQYYLPLGVHELPDVVAQKAEGAQTILSNVTDFDKMETTIKVQAEDTTAQSTYIIVFHHTFSDADTLSAILEDEVDTLPDFSPHKFYYSYSMPVGTVTFPRLGYEPADEWQTVQLITVDSTDNTYIRQLLVTSESGKKNTYTVSYTILKSDVDTLQMILVNGQQLDGFRADSLEYNFQLTAAQAKELDGAMPDVLYVEGDEYQTVIVSQAKDSLSNKVIGYRSLGYKSLVTVTAATGTSRTYTIHYPVELSTETTLNMIMLGGKPLTNYVAERLSYKIEIEKDAAIPVVSVIKKEEAQTYEIYVLEDTVLVEVTAEDLLSKQTYTLIFERQLSANTLLRDIILRDADGEQLPSAVFPFRPETFEYPTINLPYSADKTVEEMLPSIELVFSDSLQKAEIEQHDLQNGDVQIDITVTAPNGEDQDIYSLTFHFVKPSDALLTAIMLGEESLIDFDPSVTEYTYVHPFGTEPEELFTAEDVSYVLSDSLATASVSMDESGVIIITVIAQDGVTENSYFIRQEIGKDSNNDLAWITLNGDTLPGFDPAVTFYTYLLADGAPVPVVEAEALSVHAEVVSISQVAAGDTCVIICRAADESMKRYYIHFAISTINDGQEAQSNDVLIKRMPGTYQIVIATLRKDVSFAMYDQYGHLVFISDVPVANPNDVDVRDDANGQEVLNDVSDPSAGVVVEVIPGQVYFYSFFVSGGKKSVKQGKFMCL